MSEIKNGHGRVNKNHQMTSGLSQVESLQTELKLSEIKHKKNSWADCHVFANFIENSILILYTNNNIM